MKARGEGPDFVTVDGKEGGTGAAPLAFADHVALPYRVAFPRVYKIFSDEGLADDLREELAAVERAEARLAAGTYGVSIESGEPIPDERLEALPTAERTAAEEAAYERGR